MNSNGIIGKPNRDSNKELDRKIAQLMGLEISEGQYRSAMEGQNTIFTNPPQFSASKGWIDYMLRFANQNDIKVTSYDPESLCNEIIAGCR